MMNPGDVSIQNSLHVPHLVPCAMVLHEGIGVKHIGSDLASQLISFFSPRRTRSSPGAPARLFQRGRLRRTCMATWRFMCCDRSF